MQKFWRGIMAIPITINAETCNVCGLCGEICPNKIFIKEDSSRMAFRMDRIHLCVKCGQCMAVCPMGSVNVNGLSYSRDFIDSPQGGDYQTAFMNMIATRRAIRNFADKPVPRELLEKIVDAISYAPPSFPPIKTELVIVKDKEVIQRALPQMIGMYELLVKAMANPVMRFFIKMQIGKEKYRSLINHVIPIMKVKLPSMKSGEDDSITRNAPAMIIFHANKSAENFRTDIKLALTYGFLAAHALGLGGSAIDLIPPTIERSKELRKLFLIPEGNEVVAAMIVGFPKYKYKRVIKRELKNVKWI
jgi:ferredoxin